MNKIVWTPIKEVRGKNNFTNSPIESALLKTGIPSLENANSPKEDAITLLKLASEIEHALMVQYLYSSLSVKGAFSKVISSIAIQEMGHFLTVQNLLLSINGISSEGIPIELHFGRDKLRNVSDLNPIPFILEKVSYTSLSKFVIIEKPEFIEDEITKLKVDKLEADLDEKNISFNPVYSLYAAIEWLFQKNDSIAEANGLSTSLGFKPGWHLKDEDFSNDKIAEFTSEKEEWGGFPGLIVKPVTNREEALAAITLITEQGEGNLNHTDSHFAKFYDLLNRFESSNIRIKDLPNSPFVGSIPPIEDKFAVKIEFEYTSLWAQLFNNQYDFLLLDIAQAVSLRKGNSNRKLLIDLTIKSMSSVIKGFSKDLMKRKINDNSPRKAGPPYQLTYEETPSTFHQFNTRYRSLELIQNNLINEIQTKPEYELDRSGARLITLVKSIAEERINIINQINM